MDPVQLTIIAVSLVLTGLFVFLGVQVWLILKEMRASLQKVNTMLTDATKVTGTVSEGFTSVAGLMSGLKAGISFITSLRGRKKGDGDE